MDPRSRIAVSLAAAILGWIVLLAIGLGGYAAVLIAGKVIALIGPKIAIVFLSLLLALFAYFYWAAGRTNHAP